MTFTKEQLIDQAREEVAFWRERDELIPSQQTAIRLRLAEITLAALTAEPVGEVVLGEYDESGCHPDARVVCIAADGQADWENFKDGTRLYAAPPAPVVPDCFKRLLHHAYGMTMGHDWNKGTMAGHHREKMRQAVEECRAAMLQPTGFIVTSDERLMEMPRSDKVFDLLQCAEPVKEWIPCSERMPEKMVSVLATGDWFDYAVTAWDGGAWLDFDDYEPPVTHWMSLPAAPQQEVFIAPIEEISVEEFKRQYPSEQSPES